MQHPEDDNIRTPISYFEIIMLSVASEILHSPLLSLSFCTLLHSLTSTWLVSGLILVGEPYYNEAGYERQRGTQQGLEASI